MRGDGKIDQRRKAFPRLRRAPCIAFADRHTALPKLARTIMKRLAQGKDAGRYCTRTVTLSAAPRLSVTVKRTKPGPCGEKNSVRLPVFEANGTPSASTVSGPLPVTLTGTGSNPPSFERVNSSRTPFGGNITCGRFSAFAAILPSPPKCCSGGGKPALVAVMTPLGAG